MTEVNPPGFMQNLTTHTAEIDRGTFSGLVVSTG